MALPYKSSTLAALVAIAFPVAGAGQSFQTIEYCTGFCRQWMPSKVKWELRAGELVLIRESGNRETYKFAGAGRDLPLTDGEESRIEYDVLHLETNIGVIDDDRFTVRIQRYRSPQSAGALAYDALFVIDQGTLRMQHRVRRTGAPRAEPALQFDANARMLQYEWYCKYAGETGSQASPCTPSRKAGVIKWSDDQITIQLDSNFLWYPSPLDRDMGWELKLDRVKDQSVAKRSEYRVWNRRDDKTTDYIWIEENERPRRLGNGFEFTHQVSVVGLGGMVEEFYANEQVAAAAPGMNSATSAQTIVRGFLDAIVQHGLQSKQAGSYISPAFVAKHGIKHVLLDMGVVGKPWKYVVEKVVNDVLYVAVWMNQSAPRECYLFTMRGVAEGSTWYIESQIIGATEVAVAPWKKMFPDPGLGQTGYYTPGSGPYN